MLRALDRAGPRPLAGSLAALLAPRLPALLLTAALATPLALTGCAIDERDLEGWPAVAGGKGRLAAVLADDHRDGRLRSQAATLLIREGALDHLMGVVQTATPEQRGGHLDRAALAIVEILTAPPAADSAVAQANAASLGYYLLEYIDEIQAAAAPPAAAEPLDAALDAQLVGALVDWSLTQLHRPENERAKPSRKLEDIVLAALVARPAIAAPRVLDRMRTAADVRSLLAMNALLSPLAAPELRRAQAEHLLAFARTVHPEVPPALAQAMVDNRNPPLLHYLLDAARDPRVPVPTREIGLLAAKNLLKTDALGGLLLLLREDDPASQNIFRLNALDYAWDLGGPARLADALQALPPEGTWWPDGVMFRAHVDSFCDHKLAPARDAVRPVLERLVDDPNWVTRAYALRCVERLYPADAARLLAPLVDDETPLPGWDAAGATTLGAHARAVVATARGE